MPEPILEPQERQELTRILARLPDFRDERARSILLSQAGLEQFASGMDLSGPPRVVAGDLVDRLETYGELPDRPSYHALGALLDYVQQLPDVPSNDASFITSLSEKYALLAGVSPSEKPRMLQTEGDVACPYRGLKWFEEEHAEFYFGRELLVQQLVAELQERSFVAVVGPSGCGKSSLVRAGLTSALARERAPDKPSWVVRFFRPGKAPLQQLAGVLASLLEPEADRVAHTVQAGMLADHLSVHRQAMVGVATQLREVHPDLSRIVLVADQFEELWTECQEEKVRRCFAETLLAASGEGIRIVVTLRADFYGRALSNRELGEAIIAGLVNVLPMSEDGLSAAVELPALKLGRAFQPGLVERIVDDVAGEPGNLPLLEFALTEMWTRRTADGVLTHSAYEAIGEVEGAVARYADQVYGELGAAEQWEARRAFLQMVRPGEGTEDTRRLAYRAELGEGAWGLVRRLADARLVVTSQDRSTGHETVELVHEALIQRWGQLRDWMDADRDFRVWQERLRAGRRQWEESHRDEDLLLRGAPLAAAQEWLEKRKSDLNEEERAFIGESLASDERKDRIRRRTRNAIIGMAIAIAVLVSALSLILGSVARTRAEDIVTTAEARLATAEAQRDDEIAAGATAEAQRDNKITAGATAEAAFRATVEAIAARATTEAIAAAEVRATATAAAGVKVQPFEPEMVLIPAGEFLMGSDPAKDKDGSEREQPQHLLYLPEYSIGKTPVTNAQYLAFVQSTGHTPPEHWADGEPPRGKENHPVVNVSWYDAMEFCRWLTEVTGKVYTLPSEAEWEKAARGTDGRIYPWGDKWDVTRCNTDEGGIGHTTPVDAYPLGASPYGVLDTAGNVWEWTRSLWKYYPYDAADGREDLDSEGGRVARGGSFNSDRRSARCASRYGTYPDGGNLSLGFRVVVSPIS